MTEPRRPLRVSIVLPWRTVFTVLAAAALVWALWRCGSLLLLLYLAALIAITLDPVVGWLQRRVRLPHGVAVATVALLLLAALVGTAALVVPPLVGQARGLVEQLPTLRERGLAALPEGWPREAAQAAIGGGIDLAAVARSAGPWLSGTFNGATALVLLLALTVYLLMDGRSALRWLRAYIPERYRPAADRTASEIAPVVLAYVAGQAITSLLSAVFTFVLLWWLGVPGALVLAILAGVMDVLPVLGFIISLAPAVLIALSVSPSAAAITVAGFVVYNLLENYLIVPWVYGNRMQLSTLTVLLALLIGGALAGIAGMIAALPIVAVYPIVERIWLADRVGRQAVEEHQRQQDEPPPHEPA